MQPETVQIVPGGNRNPVAPSSTMTEGQAYRAVRNLTINELGLTRQDVRKMLEEMVHIEVRNVLTTDKIQAVINAEVKAAFAGYFRGSSSQGTPQEQMRRFVADEVSKRVKDLIQQRLYIKTTVEPID